MFEDVVTTLLAANRVIIPFEVLHGVRDVSVIVTLCGDELASFNFIDEGELHRSPLTSADLQSALQELNDHVVLQSPITVQATTTWTSTNEVLRVEVHGLTISDPLKSATLSREGAVYEYSMSLSVSELAAAI